MSMSVGSATITVATDGTATYGGSGMTLALAQARFPATLADIVGLYPPPLTATQLSFAQRFAAACAVDAKADATALVAYVQANAVAHVTSEQLGAMPSSTSAGTPIEAPASPVDVPIQ